VFNGFPAFGEVRCEGPRTRAGKFVSPIVYWRSKVRLRVRHSLSQMRGPLASFEGAWSNKDGAYECKF
jgi:hypothetical protein